MTLPVFILLAVAIPIALLVFFWASARFITWTALRPRTLGVIQVLFGLSYLIVFWFIEPRTGLRVILPTILGALFIAQGLYNWFRGQPVRFE